MDMDMTNHLIWIDIITRNLFNESNYYLVLSQIFYEYDWKYDMVDFTDAHCLHNENANLQTVKFYKNLSWIH